MKTVATAAATVLLVPVILLSALLGGLGPHYAPATAEVPVGIPAPLDSLYPNAASSFGIPAGLLAAIGKVECDHGRDRRCASPTGPRPIEPFESPQRTSPRCPSSGGPASFAPTAGDIAFGFAARLADADAAGDVRGALATFDPADSYAACVMAWAVRYGWAPFDARLLAWALLNHPNIAVRPQGQADVRSGLVDRRVLAALLTLGTSHRLFAVGPFVSGHSRYVAGSNRLSNHVLGRAVDVPAVDGAAIDPGNSRARAAAELLLTAPDWFRPDELGCPWRLALGGVVTFTEGHDDHLHIGFDK